MKRLATKRLAVRRRAKTQLAAKRKKRGAFTSPPKGMYDTTQEWLKNARRPSYKVIHPEEVVALTPPKTLDPVVHPSFSIPLTNGGEAYTAVLRRGRVCGRRSVVISADNRVILDVSAYAKPRRIFRKRKLVPAKYFAETVAVLTHPWGSNYFHWMYDTLPRLGLIRRSGRKIDRYLVNNLSRPFHYETLKALGIPKDRIVESGRRLHLRAEKLVLSSWPRRLGFSKWPVQFLRDSFLPLAGDDQQTGKKRYYISRQDAPTRRVVNESELIETLRPFGFIPVCLDNMPIIEQVRLFRSAEAIVAPHGAGLLNAVFCDPGTKVIELFSEHYTVNCYWLLSSYMNLDYYYLIDHGPKQKNLNHRVETNELVRLLNMAGIEAGTL